MIPANEPHQAKHRLTPRKLADAPRRLVLSPVEIDPVEVYAVSGQKHDLASGVALLKQLERLAHIP